MDLNTPVYYCPKGALAYRGINIEQNTNSSKLRLIIITDNIRLYFRERDPAIKGDTYVCYLDYLKRLQQP